MDKIKRFLPIFAVITGVLAIIAYCALPVLEFTLEEFSFEKVEIFKVEYSGTKAMFGFDFYGETV